MIDIQDWDSIEERQDGDYNNPTPGGYIVKITAVNDKEEKQYLEISYDFAEGEFKGEYQRVYDRSGFWPGTFIRSYKQRALPFFKGFKTCLETSNRGYQFNTRSLDSMIGKYLGLVLGEEEYWSSQYGEIRKRLRVDQVRSVQAIRDGDFKVPVLKKYKDVPPTSGVSVPPPPADWEHPASAPVQQQSFGGYQPHSYTPKSFQSAPDDFYPLPDDGDIPF